MNKTKTIALIATVVAIFTIGIFIDNQSESFTLSSETKCCVIKVHQVNHDLLNTYVVTYYDNISNDTLEHIVESPYIVEDVSDMFQDYCYRNHSGF